MTAATVAIIMGSVVSAGTSIYAAQQASKARKEQAQMLAIQSLYESEVFAEETEGLEERQRAAYAAAGIEPDMGSPLTIMKDTRRKRDKDIAAIKMGYGFKGAQLRSEAAAISTTGYMKAGSTLLTGVGTAGYYGGWGQGSPSTN